MITRKNIALTRQTFVSKVMSLHFNSLSGLVIAFLPRSKCLLISWLQSASTVIFSQFSHSVVSNSCDPMDCSTPGLPVHHHCLEFAQTHIHWVSDAIPTVSSSVIPFFFCLQSFSASGYFPVSQFFASGGPSIGISTSTSVFPMNTQDWSHLEWTGWISLQSKGLTKVFSNTTVQKH